MLGLSDAGRNTGCAPPNDHQARFHRAWFAETTLIERLPLVPRRPHRLIYFAAGLTAVQKYVQLYRRLQNNTLFILVAPLPGPAHDGSGRIFLQHGEMSGRSYYVIYRDSQTLWRWSYITSNGRTIAVSKELYHNKSDCEHSVNLVKASSADPVIER